MKTIIFTKIKEYKLLLILILCAISLCLIFTPKTYASSKKTIKKSTKTIKEEKKKMVKVDVKGFVANPNVYEIEENGRVIDAIKAAGGLIEGANTELINLSQKLTDEMVIIVYSNWQINEYRNSKKEVVYIEVDKCPDNTNDACINKKTSNNTLTGKVNINSASEAELTKISGVGASKAKDIIEYREQNGGFKQIEDIKNIKGIGDALFEKIKDSITV